MNIVITKVDNSLEWIKLINSQNYQLKQVVNFNGPGVIGKVVYR